MNCLSFIEAKLRFWWKSSQHTVDLSTIRVRLVNQMTAGRRMIHWNTYVHNNADAEGNLGIHNYAGRNT